LNPAEASLSFYPNRPELVSHLLGLVSVLLTDLPQANEDLRAQHRYLDLRRADLAENLKIRSKVAHTIRNYLHDQGEWLELLELSYNSVGRESAEWL
jgi:aspartyl-tRNA synthetase